VIVLGLTDGLPGGLAAVRGGDGVLSMSQARWQMLELAIRSTSNLSDAPLGQDTFGVSLSAAPGGGSSGRGEPAGGAEMRLGERRVVQRQLGWWGRQLRWGSTGWRGRRRCQATCSRR